MLNNINVNDNINILNIENNKFIKFDSGFENDNIDNINIPSSKYVVSHEIT